jgi:alpha-beta hydrolase superfamily lysophospholipase
VTIARLDGARHDVYLSEKAVRDDAFTLTARWLHAVVPTQP